MKYLPPESAYFTTRRETMSEEEIAALPKPVTHGPWSKTETLLATAVDLLNHLQWQNQVINRGKNSPMPKHPEPISRPGVTEAKPSVPIETIQLMEMQRRQRKQFITAQKALGGGSQ